MRATDRSRPSRSRQRPRNPRTRPPLRRRLRLAVLLIGGAAVLAAAVWAIAAAQQWVLRAAAQPPGVGTVILAPAESKAHAALDAAPGEADDANMTEAERRAAAHLAAQPTAYWLTPEQDPPGTAGSTVTGLLAQAREAEASLALVIYGLPGRDCGNHSAGGLSDELYQRWVGEIAAALATGPDVQTIVVLEPDSLALAPQCGNLDERAPQLHAAVDRLSVPGVWIYLDGGHSAWLPASEMASLIDAVDVAGRVRGFATNVSNYRATHDEFEYAHAVAAHLDGQMHAVVDTSRNGAASAGSEWCNPPGQLIGDAGGTFGDEVVDTNLWIKPPGESDGPCHGGPAAGVWWPQAAVELVGDAVGVE